MIPENSITKFTLKDWVRHPTTILLVTVTMIAWGVTWIYVQSQLEQVTYLRDRVDKLEKQVDQYTTAIMYKDGQIKMRDIVIDSLARKGEPVL